MLAAIAAPMNAAIWEPEAEEKLQLGPIENPSSPMPARGYQSRPCGFDLNHNGIVGEPADCNVCDASLVDGRIVANTRDPDGDGVNEDQIYVDCDGGLDNKNCGLPGAVPCLTIEYAWQNRADGPEDGAEDIVCFTGTCRPDSFLLPEAYNGVPGHWIKPRTGTETRDWQFPDNPAILSGWDTDNDGKYPPFDTDDLSVLDGSGLRRAFKLNAKNANSYFEMAHFVARKYGVHTPDEDGGGFIIPFEVTRETSHGYFHDLSLYAINRNARLRSPSITFDWFNSAKSSHIALVNIESLEEGSYSFRGNADPSGEVIAGPWRFQNLTITAHGCDKALCGNRATKVGWKLWGWADGIEILDSIFDGNVSKWSPSSMLNGIVVNAHTVDWDIINNELIDWSAAIIVDGKIPDAYTVAKRYTDDIVISKNLIRNSKWDRNISIRIDGSGGNGQAVGTLWLLNNVMTSSLSPIAHVLIRQGNTEGPCVTNVRIFNNTFFGRADDTIRVADPGTPFRAEKVRLKNNIIAGQYPEGTNLELVYPPVYWESDFNVFDSGASFSIEGTQFPSLSDWRAATGGDFNSLGCQPMFKSPPFDLHLDVADLCAKDKGKYVSSSLTTTDFELDSRPEGRGWDIGADEWHHDVFSDSLECGSWHSWSSAVP